MINWPLRRLATTVFSVQLVIFSLIALERIGLPVGLAIAPVVLPYLLIIPGCLILRSIGHHSFGLAGGVSVTVGLSLLSVMGIGLLLNQVGPLIGLERPLE